LGRSIFPRVNKCKSPYQQACCKKDDSHCFDFLKLYKYRKKNRAYYLDNKESIDIFAYQNRYQMKSYRKELTYQTETRRTFINITPEIENCLGESGIKEGLLLCNTMHITASVFINDDEAGLHVDLEQWLEKLAPEKPHDQYRHNGYEDNADAHLKRQVMGREVVVAVSGGKLDFGPWEQIFYGEFDGKRRKRVLVKIIGE